MMEIDDSFYARLALAMASLEAEGKTASRTLAISVGEASVRAARDFAATVPAGALILYLYESRASKRLSPQERHELALLGVLAEEFERSGFLRERIFSALAAAHAANVKFNCQKGVSQDLVSWLQLAISDGFEKRNNRMRTWQIRLRCAIANLPQIAGSGRMEMPSFDPSVPALVCGAGPSVAGQLAKIREIKNNFIVICAGRAAKMFAEAGIQPDYVVDIEQNAQLYWPAGLRFRGTLVAHESIEPIVSQSFSKHIWTDCGLNPLRGLLASCGIQLPSIPANGPVASVMLGFAIACGARRIGLCGYDLAPAQDGKSYADGEGSMDQGGAALVKVPSVSGGEIGTLPHFEAMRRDLQSSIEMLRRSGLLFEIFNCSAYGAEISGARTMPLDRFASSFGTTEKQPHREAFASLGGNLGSALDKELEAAGAAEKSIARMAGQLQELESELLKPVPDVGKVHAMEQAMPSFFKEEQATRALPNGSELAYAAFTQASLVSEQWPTRKPADALIARRCLCRHVMRQSLLQRGFLLDAIDDANEVKRSLASGARPKIDVHTHPALKSHAARIVRRGNPELAELLEHTPPVLKPRGFETLSKLLSPPVVLSMDAPDGSKIQLAEACSYAGQIKTAADSILRDSAFDPAQDAIVLSGHVNWGLASEIPFRMPEARMIVLFPWFELLAFMSSSCEFMGLLPDDALLVCPCDACPNWRKPLEERLNYWKSVARRILIFENEATKGFPECSAPVSFVRETLKS